MSRRIVSRGLWGAALVGTLAVGRPSFAEQAPPVDVAIKLPPPQRRVVTVEWNPLPLFTIGKLSANLVIAPVDHHSLILSPFYSWVTTNDINVYDDQGNQTQLPKQTFKSYGGELGYRYYFGLGGPRGFFLGPSFILAGVNSTAQNGDTRDFMNLGFAADAGYEMLVADRVALSLGAGVQYTTPTKTIPAQQFPAEIYVNAGVRPRLLLSCGWAF